jgi:GNAT superfamily N-acetyltransferase
MASLTVRSIRPGEAALALRFIRELAEYERLLDHVEANEAAVDALLFGPTPRAFCDIAELDGEPVGVAFWFYNISTFHGRCGIYLEDLYVRPEARQKGVGSALLARLAKRCVEEGLSRLEWTVLEWNAPSIAFYDSLGAASKSEWTIRSLSGDALAKLAATR